MFTEVLPRLCAIQPDLTGRQLPTYLPIYDSVPML